MILTVLHTTSKFVVWEFIVVEYVVILTPIHLPENEDVTRKRIILSFREGSSRGESE